MLFIDSLNGPHTLKLFELIQSPVAQTNNLTYQIRWCIGAARASPPAPPTTTSMVRKGGKWCVAADWTFQTYTLARRKIIQKFLSDTYVNPSLRCLNIVNSSKSKWFKENTNHDPFCTGFLMTAIQCDKKKQWEAICMLFEEESPNGTSTALLLHADKTCT